MSVCGEYLFNELRDLDAIIVDRSKLGLGKDLSVEQKTKPIFGLGGFSSSLTKLIRENLTRFGRNLFFDMPANMRACDQQLLAQNKLPLFIDQISIEPRNTNGKIERLVEDYVFLRVGHFI